MANKHVKRSFKFPSSRNVGGWVGREKDKLSHNDSPAKLAKIKYIVPVTSVMMQCSRLTHTVASGNVNQ